MKQTPRKKILFVANLLLLFVLLSAVWYYTVKFWTFSQFCYTPAQIQSDTKCLYILNNKVFEKGTRASPHKGHPCGIDVTSIIHSFHLQSPAIYLDPNYVGNICPAATNTPIPTLTPVNTCPRKPQGDADCNGVSNIVDFEVWRKEFTGTLMSKQADFNGDSRVDLIDFEIWRRNLLF